MVVSDTYTSSDILEMVSEVISVLCFRLLPPSPYELGDELLCQARCESLLLSYRTLLNGVCSSLYKYEE